MKKADKIKKVADLARTAPELTAEEREFLAARNWKKGAIIELDASTELHEFCAGISKKMPEFWMINLKEGTTTRQKK